jgi:undecaprenyl-diphosphatase
MPMLPSILSKNFVRRLCTFLKRVAPAEKTALLVMSLAGLAFFVFAAIASEMAEGETNAFDYAILLAFRNPADLSDPIGPRWLEEMMRDFTALGSVAVLATLTLGITGFLLLVRKRRVAWMILSMVVGGWLTSTFLKWGYARPRPDLVPHGTMVYTQSFPSGHAMLSAVVYLTLGALLARAYKDPRVKVYLVSIAGALTIIVGISRIYLGVHWPSDVLAGWAAGAGWALLCWMTMLWLQGQGKVESETPMSNDEVAR